MSEGRILRCWEEIPLPTGNSTEERVTRFLALNSSLLGISLESGTELIPQKIQNTNLGKRYTYIQKAHNLPVFDAQLILLESGDRIRSLFNALSLSEFSEQKPEISPISAIALGKEALKIESYRRQPSVELGYNMEGDLIYRVRIPGLDPPADWEVCIDAKDGSILRAVDRRIFVDGAGYIFNPDPMTVTEDTTLSDHGDSSWAIPFEAYSEVFLLDLNEPTGGYYTLDGPFVSTDLTSNRAHEITPEFYYLRDDDRFEEAMVYYHIDREQRYFQDNLQIYYANNRQQHCNVNGTALDQSWYSLFDSTITFGYGGVDDAEDADVIVHEYGHAVQHNILGEWTGGHTGAMGEGFGDYLAGSYSLTVNPLFQPNWVFNWDGHNEFWNGRILNANYHYPENAGGEIHDSGQLWSAGLIDVWWDISDVIAWDRIVLEHHLLLGNGALMEDAAEAILATELMLYNGMYRATIAQNFAERGFISLTNYSPQILHEPLGDTEDTLQTSFEVIAQILSEIALDPNSLQLFWRADENPYIAQSLMPTGMPNEYHGFISGPFNEQVISYYLTAADSAGMASLAPTGAPVEAYQFYVGLDTIPPEIAWMDSLGQTILLNASFPVKAIVTDNIGLEVVELHWKVGSGGWQTAMMNAVSADTFSGILTYSNQTAGELVQYFVLAIDSSSQHNENNSVENNFPIDVSAELDDFEGTIGPWIFTGNWGVTNQFSHGGAYCLEDSPGQMYPVNADTWAQWGMSFNLSDFDQTYIYFWERHLLEENSDWGRFEVSADEGPWEVLLEITGADYDWYLREIPLSDYCGGTCDSLRFRFRTITDSSGNLFGWFIDDITISVENIVHVSEEDRETTLPARFALGPIYPNPFNMNTLIWFGLPEDGHTQLDVFDIAGRLVVDLVDDFRKAGLHEVLFDGSGLASGIYFCRLKEGESVMNRKMILLK